MKNSDWYYHFLPSFFRPSWIVLQGWIILLFFLFQFQKTMEAFSKNSVFHLLIIVGWISFFWAISLKVFRSFNNSNTTFVLKTDVNFLLDFFIFWQILTFILRCFFVKVIVLFFLFFLSRGGKMQENTPKTRHF